MLDDRVITAPQIREPITGGSGQITGMFTVEGSTQLAVLLRAGALPIPVRIEEERTIGPALGQDSIRRGVRASAVGLLLLASGFGVWWLRGRLAVRRGGTSA